MNEDGKWPHQVTFARTSPHHLSLALAARDSTSDTTKPYAVCFVSIIPLENIFDWGGEQMALYLGTQLGDLLVITLNK